MELLLDAGAVPSGDTIADASGDGYTILRFATENGNHELVTFLLEHGADPMIMDFDGDRPVDCARSQYLGDRLTRAMD